MSHNFEYLGWINFREPMILHVFAI